MGQDSDAKSDSYEGIHGPKQVESKRGNFVFHDASPEGCLVQRIASYVQPPVSGVTVTNGMTPNA